MPMLASRLFWLLISILAVRALKDYHGADDAESSQHHSRPKRHRTVHHRDHDDSHIPDKIVVDKGAHAIHVNNDAASHGAKRRAEDRSDAEEDEAVMKSMGLTEDEDVDRSPPGHSIDSPKYMRRQKKGDFDFELPDLEEDNSHRGKAVLKPFDVDFDEFEEKRIAEDGRALSAKEFGKIYGNVTGKEKWFQAEPASDADDDHVASVLTMKTAFSKKSPRRRAVPCTWKGWGGWGGCSKTCGNSGFQYRYRGRNHAQHGGAGCSGYDNVGRQCNRFSCPIPCTFSSWGGWGICTKTCGSGTKTRKRTKSGPYHGGSACHGPTEQAPTCNTFSCPVDCYFQAWSGWGACTKTCIEEGNYGYKSRDRGKVGPFHGGKVCHGHTTDDGLCNTFTCPYDCEVGAWSTWSVCTQTCSVSVVTHGYKIRSRTSVAAANGGRMCAENWQMNHCNTRLCAFDCYFLEWGAWGPCTKTCTAANEASGVRIRVRDKVGPGMGGKECTGPVTNTKSCNDFNCPVDCKWEPWEAFGECSKTCAVGGRVRTRTKSLVEFGGVDCEGPTQHTEVCNAWKCPLNCRWTLWDGWMPCTKTCGGGSAHRSRSYDPKPQNGGVHCTGSHMEMISCASEECPIDCFWEEWLDWSLCSTSCKTATSSGIRTRVRLINVTAGHGGAECPGDASQETPCPEDALHPCPMDCRFDEWNDWSNCNVTCGKGLVSTSRVLLQAENGGMEECPEGEMEKEQECEAAEACEDDSIKAGAPPSLRLTVSLMLCIGAFLVRRM